MAEEHAAERADRFFLDSAKGWRVDNSKATGAPIFADEHREKTAATVRHESSSAEQVDARDAVRAKRMERASDGSDRIPDALREAGRRASELAQNPVARSLLAAGLVSAAAALAANKTVRHTARKGAAGARDAAEAAADTAAESADKVGAAMIKAATEAVRRMMATGKERTDEKTPASRPQPAKKSAGTARRSRARRTSKKADGATKRAQL